MPRMSEIDRVRRNTSDTVNRRLDQRAEERVSQYAAMKGAEIDNRLAELAREWDLERYLEANASVLGLTGLALAALHDRRWVALPTVVFGFLFQHGVQGWCPPVEVFRRLGIRTRREIDRELYALKALRGDFATVGGSRRQAATSAWSAADPTLLADLEVPARSQAADQPRKRRTSKRGRTAA